MKVSLSQIKKYIDFELPPIDELVARINAQLGGVEEVVDLGAKYKDAKVVKVMECEKHPDADRLNVTKVDDGSGELVQVVCGAPNVHADMWAVWLPPESVVPSTYGTDDEFKLGARKLRGVMSHGMLAAGDELDINSDHDGIVEIAEGDVSENGELKPGASFAKLFGLDDYVIDIENKMFTHRPDLFGQLGVAREISAILKGVTAPEEGAQDTRYENVAWYWMQPEFALASGRELEVFNDVPEKAPRAMFAVMDGVTIAPSPLWLQCELVAMGGKPINNIVDITNYAMLLTAQPTHAYDYDKIRGHKIGVRMAQAGETIKLLNDKTYELSEDDIVIADGEGPVGLAGIMGGGESEVSDETTTIVLEVATFDMYAVRKSAMRHGVFTDALTRFNKGQSPLQNNRVMKYLINHVAEVAGGVQASDVYDESDRDWTREVAVHDEIRIDVDFIADRLGVSLTLAQIGNLLRRVNFASYPPEDDGKSLLVTAPFWRTDIEQPEDIVEEVGRLYGFDKLPRELPQKSASPVAQNPGVVAKQAIRETLSRAGGNEVLTYSFVHENVLKKAGQDAVQAFQISNALSPDLQYYRLSVLPSLLDKVHGNIKAGHDEFLLYEVGKAHHVDAIGEDKLPQEFGRVAGVYAARRDSESAAYYQAKRTVEYLISELRPGAKITYVRLDEYNMPDFKPFQQLLAPFDPVRTAIVEIDGKLAGVMGEFRGRTVREFKLPARVAGFELFTSPFVQTNVTANYLPLSKYPSVQRDVCFRVSDQATYQSVYDATNYEAEDMRVTCDPVDIYQAKGDKSKNITLRFTISPHSKTLAAEDAAQIIDAIVRQVQAATGAQVV